MSRAVKAYGFLNTTGLHDLLQFLAHRPVIRLTEHQFVFLQVFVAVDNLQGYVHQLYLVRDACLVTVADNPLVTVDVHDVVRSQFLNVNKRQGGETDKDEDVTHKGKIIVLKLMRHNGFQLILS